jgi:hypothetical protein
MNSNEIISKIITWIQEDKGSKYNVSRVENKNNDPNFPYILKITDDKNITKESLLPRVYIFKPRQYEDKIGVYSGISFTEEQKRSFDVLKPDIKRSITNEIINGLSMMNLLINIHPSDKDVKEVHFQEIIYFDGLTKDRIMNSIPKVLNGFLYMLTVLDKYNITRPSTFDPSKLK